MDPIRVLADEIKRLKGEENLKKVSVIVDSHETGVLTRRNLAPLFAVPGTGNGLGAVDFITFDQLAESIVRRDGSLAKRRKSSGGVVRLAAKKVLENHSEEFPGTNQKRVTIDSFESIFRSYQPLKERDKATLRGLAGRTSTLLRVCDEISDRLSPEFYSPFEIREIAAKTLREYPKSLVLDPVIVFLPTRINPTGAEIVAGLARHCEVSAILRVFGDKDIDDPFAAWASRASPKVIETEASSFPVLNLAFVDAHDPTDEVRHALRLVIEAAKKGANFSEMEITYTSEDPYLPYLISQLARSHIPYLASPAGHLGDTAWAKRAETILEIAASPPTLRNLFDLLKLQGKLDNKDAIPISAMEEVARNVLGDLAEPYWLERLNGCASELLGALNTYQFSRNFTPIQIHQACHRLSEEIKFMAKLKESTKDTTLSFSDWIAWGDLFQLWRLEIDDDVSNREMLQARREAVAEVIRNLKKLDLVVSAVNFEEFRDSVRSAIEASRLTAGKIDLGLPIHPVWSTPFSPRKLVIVLGMTEDRVSALRAHNPLVTPYLEAKYGIEADQGGSRYFGAKATLSNIAFAAEEVVLMSSRSDLSGTKTKSPSRWLCDLISMSVGRRISTSEFLFLKDPRLTHLEGDFTDLYKAPSPIDQREINMLRARKINDSDFETASRLLDESKDPLGSGYRIKRARSAWHFSEFDGIIGEPIVSQIELQAFSPTSLERWVACPFAYFAREVLSINPTEMPSTEANVSPRDRGNIIHHALDSMVKWSLKASTGTARKPGEPWSEAELMVAISSAEEKISELAKLNRFTKPIFHEFERSRLISEIKQIVQRDSDFRERSNAEAIGSEVYFGPNERLRANLSVPGEEAIEFLGRIDRIDLRHDLNQAVVVDYKSGKSSHYKISPDNPTQDGRNLQLAIYAASLEGMEWDAGSTPQLLGEYLFTATSEEARRISLLLTDEVKERVAVVVNSIVRAIWGGSFPQGMLNPKNNPIGCKYCDPSNLRPRWHNQMLRAKLTDGAVSSFAALVYPDELRFQDDFSDSGGE
ncbi:MAG: hypothetical protein HKL83_00025 [Acidimicrobiaceae bacterium]|nr:hypothetical protein [Acidimicrobiaceae bacterium]